MKDKFVSYDIALKLKELGFNEECLGFWEELNCSWNSYSCWGGITELDEDDNYKLFLSANDLRSYYDNIIKAPLWQDAIDWFRVKHNIHIWIEPVLVEQAVSPIKFEYFILFDINKDGIKNNCLPFHLYEKASEQAILKAIELYQKNYE
jgi:hypothetical protein